jgi:hypothetical protein
LGSVLARVAVNRRRKVEGPSQASRDWNLTEEGVGCDYLSEDDLELAVAEAVGGE